MRTMVRKILHVMPAQPHQGMVGVSPV